jgi:AcrR family transcriptional regulator
MPRAERERQMLAVAEEIFAARGYLNTSVDDIAERVGVSKPMIYEYFGSKEGLLLAALRQARGELFEASSRAVVGAATAEEALRRAMTAFFRFVDEHRRSWELLRNETALAGTGAMAEVEAIRNEQSQLNATLISAFTPEVPQRQLEVLAETLVGACERVALWHVQREDSTPEATAEYLMNVIWAGMAGLTDSYGVHDPK